MPDPRRPLATADLLRQHAGDRPISVWDAGRLGITRGQLRAAIAAGHLVELRHGVVVAAAVARGATDPAVGHVLHARGLLARRPPPAGVLSHATAGAVRGLPYPGLVTPSAWPIELTADAALPASCAGSAPGAAAGSRLGAEPGRGRDWRRRCAPLPDGHVEVVADLPVTSLARTVVDIAVARPLPEALPVVDAGLRRMVLDGVADDVWWSTTQRMIVRDPALVERARATLLSTLGEIGRPRGSARGAATLRLADPAAENAFESVSRALLLLGGAPRPEVGYPVRGDDGRTYWADLAWPGLRVLAEADGRVKYTDPSVLYAEKRRQEALERAGWLVVRWTWDELRTNPRQVVARVLAALDRAARRTAA